MKSCAAAALPESARLVGINTSWMIALGWGMASAIGAIAGILIAPVVFLEPNMMGGVLIYGFAAAVLMALQLPALGSAFISSTEIVGVLAAGGLICLVGMLDDRFDLDAIAKLAGQIVAAGLLVLFGVQWQVVWLPGSGPSGGSLVSLDQTQGIVLTVLLTVVLTNAMNFIDGLDGLLAGVAAISAFAIFIFSVRQLSLSGDDSSASQPPLIAAALLGAASAQASSWSVGISTPGIVVNGGAAPLYYAPPPVYYAPPPVYYRPPPPPPPVYYQPAAPVYYGPPRGYYGPPRGYYEGPPRGYYRDGYRGDGHRGDGRRDWR